MARRPLHFCFSAILTILFPIISISSTSAQISVSVLDAKITQRYSDIHPGKWETVNISNQNLNEILKIIYLLAQTQL